MIWVIGDSHCQVYSVSDEIEYKWVGAGTAFNLINDDSETQARQKIFEIIKQQGKDQKYLFLFGEIDCRMHICLHYSKIPLRKLMPMETYVKPTVDRYFQFLMELKNRGLIIAPMTIPPAGSDQITKYGYHHPTTAEVRGKIHKCFNDLLKAGCVERGLPCVDFYDRVVGEDGLVRSCYSEDSCHLTPIVIPFLIDELKRVGWM